MQDIVQAYETLLQEVQTYENDFGESVQESERKVNKIMNKVAKQLNKKAENVDARLDSVEKVRRSTMPVACIIQGWLRDQCCWLQMNCAQKTKARTNTFENMMQTMHS